MSNVYEFGDGVKTVYAGCRSCHLTCPVWVTTKNGRAVDVEGDPRLPGPNVGKACLRAKEAMQWAYSPTRVRYPMKRAGKRGEGKWERISWDQAVDEIAEKIHAMCEKYGPETFVLPGRTGRHDMGWIAHRIARTIGTPNNYYGAIQVCFLPYFHDDVNYGSYTINGAGTSPTSLVVNVGAEQAYSFPVLTQHRNTNVEHGTKYISLDPVYGPAASKADLWLPIRPGTDLAFFMTICHYLIEDGDVDYGFVKQWTNSPFLVRSDTGGLLLESDIKKGGSERRYMVWDALSDSLKYWDADEIQWEGGPSGKAHYDELVDLYYQHRTSTEPSPAAEMPDCIDPALTGAFRVKLARNDVEVEVKPVFQKLADNVAHCDAGWCESITGIPAERTIEAAKMMGTIHPMEVSTGDQYMATNASQFFQAVNAVRMLTGNVEVPGGVLLSQFYPVTPTAFPSEYTISYNDGMDLDMKRKRLGYHEHRIGCGPAWDNDIKKWHPMRPANADAMPLYPDLAAVMHAAETGDPYEVHGIIAVSSNWLMHDPTLSRWLKLIHDEEKIQLHVVIDPVMTPTAELADYVLPGLTWLERNYLNMGTDNPPIKGAFTRAIEPICEARHDYNFGAALAKALGKYDKKYEEGLLNSEWEDFDSGVYGKFWEKDDIDEYRDYLCRKYLNCTFEEALEQRGVMPPVEPPVASGRHIIAGKFPTDTGKCNLYSTMHHKFGYPPLPVYQEPAESPLSQPETAKEYPLVLTTGKRQPGFFHSEFRQVPWAREQSPWPMVFINSQTAQKYGVAEGDWVWVEAPATGGREKPHNRVMGKVSFRLMVAPEIVSYSQHAWWRPEKSVEDELHGAFEWNAESLIEVEHTSPETGTGGYRSQLCKIYKATEEDIERYQPEITLEQLEALMPLPEEEVRAR